MPRKKPDPGICDRCDFRFPLSELRHETIRGAKQSNLVCPKCWDADHPQLFVGARSASDRATIKNPRPDRGDFVSLFAWNPIGSNLPVLSVELGKLRVTTT